MIRIIILARLGILFSSTQSQLYFISETLLFTLISHCFYWTVELDNRTIWSTIMSEILWSSRDLQCQLYTVHGKYCTMMYCTVMYIVRWCIVRYCVVSVLLTMIHEDWGMDFPPYTFRRIYVPPLPPPALLLAEVLKSSRYNYKSQTIGRFRAKLFNRTIIRTYYLVMFNTISFYF